MRFSHRPFYQATIGAPCLIALLLSTAGMAAGQTPPTITISSQVPDCSGCSVSLEKVVSLGALSDSSSVTWESTVARNSGGEFYVAPMAHAGEIYVYGPAGEYRRKLGREGEGPGEHTRILGVAIDASDSLYIVDYGNQRHTVHAPDHTVARTASLPGFVREFVLMGEGRLLVAGDVQTTRGFGLPLHLLGDAGRIERSFGGTDGVILANQPHNRMRVVANDGRQGIWAARVNRYEIERFDSLGQLKSQLVREVGWFPPWVSEGPAAFLTVPPQPRVTGLATSPRGYLLVFVLVPDPDWSPPAGGSRVVTAEWFVAQFDTVLEVLDPLDGSLLASLRFPTQLRPTVDGSLAYSIATEPSGDNRMDVWRVMIYPAPH